MIESTVKSKGVSVRDIANDFAVPATARQTILALSEMVVSLEAQVLALQSKLDEIDKQITEHNQMCIDLCADKTNCGFALYDRDCGNCKKDFMIEIEKS
jgi:hypothetical protein